MKNLIYIFVFFFFGSISAQNADALFEKATEQYNEGNYEAAISNYEQILKEEKVSASLYYNLANAHYKLNHIAPSIYYYEKALQLNPNDADIKNNLEFAENMKIDAIEEVPKTGLAKMVNNLISNYNFNTWAWLSIVFSVGFVILFLIYYFSVSTLKKRIFFSVSLLSLILCICSVVFAFQQYKIQQNNQAGIIFQEEVSVQNEPNARADEAFQLHEGTKVKILEDFSGYLKIELADGTQGWVKQTAIKKL